MEFEFPRKDGRFHETQFWVIVEMALKLGLSGQSDRLTPVP
jgi:hypothetical protein